MRLIFAFILPFSLIIAAGPLARGQAAPGDPAVLGKTTLGQSQNDERDLANSLVSGPQKFGKGEKKAQVNAAELKSKSIKDATFGGSLLNTGIDGAEPKLDASKELAAPSEEKPAPRTASKEQASSASQQPKPVEQPSDATNPPRVSEAVFSFSSLSQTATLADELGQSDVGAPASTSKSAGNSSGNGDTQKKDQGGEKSSNTTEKPADH
jgi:hypothetical protein